MSQSKSDRDMLLEIANMAGAPTMHYASDKQQRLTLEGRLAAMVQKIVTHLNIPLPPEKDADYFRTNPGLRLISTAEYDRLRRESDIASRLRFPEVGPAGTGEMGQ